MKLTFFRKFIATVSLGLILTLGISNLVMADNEEIYACHPGNWAGTIIRHSYGRSSGTVIYSRAIGGCRWGQVPTWVTLKIRDRRFVEKRTGRCHGIASLDVNFRESVNMYTEFGERIGSSTCQFSRYFTV